MKLTTNLLGKALACLGHLAGQARGADIHLANLVHIEWTTTGVTLTTSDGHRMYLITLSAERATGEATTRTIRLSPEPWSAALQLTTIFPTATGVNLIGEKQSPVGISRTRTEQDFYGLQLEPSAIPWPVEIVARARASMAQGFATDFNNRGHRVMHINTEYMGEALSTINAFWRELDQVEPPYVQMFIPAQPENPMAFVCTYPEKSVTPLLKFEAIIMPYKFWEPEGKAP